MGLLDYYRQFEGMSEEEVNMGLRAEAQAQSADAYGHARPVQTTWPELPHPSIVARSRSSLGAAYFAEVRQPAQPSLPDAFLAELHEALPGKYAKQAERIYRRYAESS
jgi:hypothetical protein